MDKLVAKTELEREAARLERELQDLEALLAKERERLSALSPLPVYWPGLTRPPPAPVTEGSNPGSAYLR
jgi:hypothetical protein